MSSYDDNEPIWKLAELWHHIAASIALDCARSLRRGPSQWTTGRKERAAERCNLERELDAALEREAQTNECFKQLLNADIKRAMNVGQLCR